MGSYAMDPGAPGKRLSAGKAKKKETTTDRMFRDYGPRMEATDADCALISKIAKRAITAAIAGERAAGRDPRRLSFDALDIHMDLTATHLNGNPLDLQRLLDADDFTFFHDVWGIQRHIDRTSGKLKDFFVPRLSRKEG